MATVWGDPELFGLRLEDRIQGPGRISGSAVSRFLPLFGRGGTLFQLKRAMLLASGEFLEWRQILWFAGYHHISRRGSLSDWRDGSVVKKRQSVLLAY